MALAFLHPAHGRRWPKRATPSQWPIGKTAVSSRRLLRRIEVNPDIALRTLDDGAFGTGRRHRARCQFPVAPDPGSDANDSDRPNQHGDQPQQPVGIVLLQCWENRLPDDFTEQEEEDAERQSSYTENLA